MAEYTLASGPEFEMFTKTSEPIRLDDEVRSKRAELFLRLPSLFSYGQPLQDILTTIAETIVEHTSAVSAAVNLVRPDDVSTIALGYHNLPVGYLEAMQAARQNSIQGEWLRERAREDRTWLLRQAPAYMSSRDEYAHMADFMSELPFDTLIGTPFLNRPDSMGFVFLYYTEDVVVDEAEVEFARDLARHARPLMDNAWLFSQTQQRANELEALSRADQALHESLVLEDVYEALLDLAVDLLGADRSLFLTFDDAGRFHAASSRGVSEEHLAGLQKVYDTIDRSRFANRTPAIEAIEDLAGSNRMTPGIREHTNAASAVDIPVFVRGEFFGIFVLGYWVRRKFTDDDRRLFETLAARAGLAIQNALLYGESKRRTSELEALSKVDQALHEALTLEDVYEALLDLVRDLFQADHSLFLTFDDAGLLHAAATRGVPPEHLEGLQPIYRATPRSVFSAHRPQVSVMEDVQNDPTLRPGIRQFTNSRSTVDVNVFVDGEFFGMFVLGYHRKRTFDENELRLFSALSARASLAIQKTLLHRQSQRRTAELEALSRADEALHTSLLLADVERTMVDLAVELLGATSALVVTWDERQLKVKATNGIEPGLREKIDRAYARVAPERFANWSAPFSPALIEDVREHSKLDEAVRLDGGIRSLAEIPVIVDGKVWGFFSVGWRKQRVFTADDRRMFDAFSSRASLAIQNALAHGETQRRANEMEALFHADEALHRSLHLEDVREALVDLALELTSADSSLVATFGEDDRMEVVAHRGIAATLLDNVKQGYTRFDRAHFRSLPQPLKMALVEDILTARTLGPEVKTGVGGSLAEVPVMVGGEIWGVFAIGWIRRRTFSDDDRKLLDTFAARASLAVQNALLFEQAQHSASMEERSRIARELHDSVSQALYGIGLGARTARRRLGDAAAADVIEPVEYIVQLAESGLAETRALIFELVPDSLEKQGLVLALQRQAAATQARYRVQTEAFLCDEPELPIRAKEALYRIAQESLHNMAKHAQATQASLRLESEDGFVRLVVRDNGKGFDPTGEFPGHLGLRSMEERATRIGAAFAIDSAPGKGTAVTVSLRG